MNESLQHLHGTNAFRHVLVAEVFGKAKVDQLDLGPRVVVDKENVFVF